MAETEYQFDRNSADRIAKVVRRIEASPRPDGSGVRSDRAGGDRRILVKVTSLTATAGMYPGIQVAGVQTPIQDPAPPITQTGSPPGFVTPAAASGGWQPLSNLTQDCWVKFNPSLTPTLSNAYVSIPIAAYTDGLPIYYACDPAQNFSGAAYGVNALTVPANTGLDLSLSGVAYDPDGYLTPPDPTFRVPAAGWYQAVFTVGWGSVPAHTQLTLQINSSDYNIVWTPGITTDPMMQGVATMYLVAGSLVTGHIFATQACSVGLGFATITRLAGSGGSGSLSGGISDINGLTGSITLTGSGVAGVGVDVSNGGLGTTITTRLSAAALAALNSFLASSNI